MPYTRTSQMWPGTLAVKHSLSRQSRPWAATIFSRSQQENPPPHSGQQSPHSISIAQKYLWQFLQNTISRSSSLEEFTCILPGVCQNSIPLQIFIFNLLQPVRVFKATFFIFWITRIEHQFRATRLQTAEDSVD